MRNVFDQYSQPENRLTHALYCTLSRDRQLIKPFLKWLGINNSPAINRIRVAQQSLPGSAIQSGEGDDGLPDLSIYAEPDPDEDDQWGVFFEMKAQSVLSGNQLKRHEKSARRFGFTSPVLVAVTVETIQGKIPDGTICVRWREIYSWFAQREDGSFWASELVRYMEVFEEKAIGEQYELRGTVTMFNGLRFDEQRPFQYLEAKRLIRLFGDELQQRKDLESKVGIDPDGARRPAITNEGAIWDFIPLKVGKGQPFIRFPHVTISLQPQIAVAAVTIPNGISGGFRSRLKEIGLQGFIDLIAEIEARLSPVLAQSSGARAFVYATQRHYKSQRSKPEIDGRLETDIRTCTPKSGSLVKYQPEWIESIFNVLIRKRSNIQCGIEARFRYDCPKVRSERVTDLFADTWKATKPLIDFAVSDE